MLHYYMFLVISIQDKDDTSKYKESEGDELNKRKRKDSDEERKKAWEMGVSFVLNTIEHNIK